jgi:hypothetical protein
MASLDFLKRYLLEKRRREGKRLAKEEAWSRLRREEQINEFLARQKWPCFIWAGENEIREVVDMGRMLRHSEG